jgi:hypothetical protein
VLTTKWKGNLARPMSIARIPTCGRSKRLSHHTREAKGPGDGKTTCSTWVQIRGSQAETNALPLTMSPIHIMLLVAHCAPLSSPFHRRCHRAPRGVGSSHASDGKQSYALVLSTLLGTMRSHACPNTGDARSEDHPNAPALEGLGCTVHTGHGPLHGGPLGCHTGERASKMGRNPRNVTSMPYATTARSVAKADITQATKLCKR